MDFESPDVAKDFPGLYASESGKRSNDSDLSDSGDHDKLKKKVLGGLHKDKKEKKDRGYAALAGESSPEEETEAKSPTKSKKTKSFKFPSTSKSKEKREKSRDKEKTLERESKEKDLEKDKKKEKDHEKEKKKDKEKDKKEKDKKEKHKEKEKEEKSKSKDKDKEKSKDKDKEKSKEKDKKDKKLYKIPSTVTSGVPFEEIFTIGVALPIFGVTLQVSSERMRCHDDVALPLIVRDCIDYLQIHGLKSPQIYRNEPDKIKLQQLRKLYDDRVGHYPYHWDVPVACALLKMFLGELTEPILTYELCQSFEQAVALPEPKRFTAMLLLIDRLPSLNRTLVGWLFTHLNCVLSLEAINHANIQIICSNFGTCLKMSQIVFTYLTLEAKKIFSDVVLEKYTPPLPSIPNDFPDSDAAAISQELRKQESLLSQIHAEMHAGFSTPAREELLWEGQRIVTHLKRKLRLVQKSSEPMSLSMQQSSIEERPAAPESITVISPPKETVPAAIPHVAVAVPHVTAAIPHVTAAIPHLTAAIPHVSAATAIQEPIETAEPIALEPDFEAAFPPNLTPPHIDNQVTFEDNFDPKPEVETTPNQDTVDNKPKLSDMELQLLRLRLENAEFLQLKSLLQAKINSEKFEIVKLKSQMAIKSKLEGNQPKNVSVVQDDEETLIRLKKENAILEQKRQTLINEIFQERCACVQLKIDLAMKEIL